MLLGACLRARQSGVGCVMIMTIMIGLLALLWLPAPGSTRLPQALPLPLQEEGGDAAYDCGRGEF